MLGFRQKWLGWIAASVSALSLLAVAVAQTGARTSAAGRTTFYEIYQGCPSDPFWIAVNNGAKAAARELHVHLVISAPTQCGSVPGELSLLQGAISAHPAGIALSVIDPRAFGAAIQQAVSAHIPFVAYNSEPTKNNPKLNPYEAYIGQPNEQAGVGVGQHAITTFNLKSGDQVVVANQEPTNVTLTARYHGIKAALAKVGVKTAQIDSTNTVTTGITVVESYVRAHPTVKAIITLGPVGTAEVMGALNALGKTGKIGVAAFDLDSVTLHYIEKGDIAFTDDQQPFLEGYDALMELYQQARWKAQPVNISTGPVYLTPQNVKQLAPYVNETGF